MRLNGYLYRSALFGSNVVRTTRENGWKTRGFKTDVCSQRLIFMYDIYIWYVLCVEVCDDVSVVLSQLLRWTDFRRGPALDDTRKYSECLRTPSMPCTAVHWC